MVNHSDILPWAKGVHRLYLIGPPGNSLRLEFWLLVTDGENEVLRGQVGGPSDITQLCHAVAGPKPYVSLNQGGV
jgi:hypothetical protein